MSTNEKIIEQLKSMNINPDEITSDTRDALIEIQKYIDNSCDEMNRAKQIWKSNKPTIEKACASCGISRASLYRDDVLRSYLEDAISQIKDDIGMASGRKIRDTIQVLNSEIKRLKKRDAECIELKKTIDRLSEELNQLKIKFGEPVIDKKQKITELTKLRNKGKHHDDMSAFRIVK